MRAINFVDLESGTFCEIKAKWHQNDTFDFAAVHIAQLDRQDALTGLCAALILADCANCVVFCRLAGNCPILIGFLQSAGPTEGEVQQ